MATRAVIVHGNGAVTLADGNTPRVAASDDQGTPYDLDNALKEGGEIVGQVIPIGSGSSILITVEEKVEENE